MIIKFVVWFFIIFILYLLIDFFRLGINKFFDKWIEKLLWIWLPFYALPRLIKEVFSDSDDDKKE